MSLEKNPSIEVEVEKLEPQLDEQGNPKQMGSDGIFRDVVRQIPISFNQAPFSSHWALLETQGDDGKKQNWAVLTLSQNNLVASFWFDENDMMGLMQSGTAVGMELNKMNVQKGGLMIASPEQAKDIIQQQASIKWPPEKGI
jgi:hypothetical protein